MKAFSLPQFSLELQQHLAAHPLAQPADLVKYCRQRAYGASRRYPGEQAAMQALAGEYAALAPDNGAPLLEPLGPDTVRLDLAGAAARGLTPAQLARACTLDSLQSQPDEEWFAQALDALEQLASRNALPPACCRGMREFLALYREKGCPPLRHSEVYRSAYRPHYRVFRGPVARLLPLMAAVSQHASALPASRRLAVALEGSCGAGKTEAAGWLAEIFGAGVVHMHDFFLPPHLRTAQRRSQPGGNIHYERFSVQVSPRLPWREPFSYQRFDCVRLTMAEWQKVPAVPVVFVEGAYSMHPACRSEYGLKVFFEVSPQMQQERLMKRGGADQWYRFRDEWIPMERLYQEHFQIRRQADLIVE